MMSETCDLRFPTPPPPLSYHNYSPREIFHERDYRFVVPSPTVRSDKIFYSSDSDWDERACIDDVLEEISSLAIVPCHVCGYQELKQQLCANEQSLCLKCKKGSVVNDEDEEEGASVDQDNKKRKKKKKKKAGANVLSNKVFDEYEGTPEGVKVYKKIEEESSQNIDDQAREPEVRETRKVKSKKYKEPNKSKLEISPSKIRIENKCDDSSSINQDTSDITDQDDDSTNLMLTSIVAKISLFFTIICQSLVAMKLMLIKLPQSTRTFLLELYQDSILENYCAKTYRFCSDYYHGTKSTKYSRRRKMIK